MKNKSKKSSRGKSSPQSAAHLDQRQSVLTKSLQLASQQGLEALSVGSLAFHLKMSRSGLFYYVKALGDFQIELIDFAAEIFKKNVIDPVLYIPNPLDKVRQFLVCWPGWTERSNPELIGGCPLVAFLFELDAKEGPLRERILFQLNRYDEFLKFLFQSCVESREFNSKKSSEDFVRACWGFYLPLLWMRQRGGKSFGETEILKQVNELLSRFQKKE